MTNTSTNETKTTAKNAEAKNTGVALSSDNEAIRYCQGRVTFSRGTLPAGVSWG